MKKTFLLLMAGIFIIASIGTAVFAEGDDKGSGYVSQGGDSSSSASQSKNDMQDAMRNYIEENSTDGVLQLRDPQADSVRNLSFMDLHAKVGMKNGEHYSCADFKDTDTGEIVDVDLYVDVSDGDIKVSKALVHKVDGDPVDDSGSVMKGSDAHMKGSMKGSGY